MDYSKKQVNDLIEGIYDGSITEYDIPESLYFAIAEELKAGLLTGWDAAEGVKDYALLNELNQNIYMFSAAKSYTELKDMRSLLIDGENIRSFSQFKEACQAKYDLYNVDYLKAEYNTALASGDMAVKWDSAIRDKDILPLLKYHTTGGDVCQICRPLDGVTLPIDSSFWKTRYPPNHFNCFCIVTQEEEGVITSDIPDTLHLMADEFKMNVGLDKYVFSPEHPYFQVEPKDRAYAANNFDLPIPNTD